MTFCVRGHAPPVFLLPVFGPIFRPISTALRAQPWAAAPQAVTAVVVVVAAAAAATASTAATLSCVTPRTRR